MADEKPVKGPPHMSYRTFANYLEALQGGIPGRIDRSVLGNYSGVAQSLLLGALQFFDMIDTDGHPTEFLERVVSAPSEGRKKLLAVALESRYGYLFRGGFNLEKATTRQLHEQFEKAGISGDTVRKAARFFIFAARDAGIPLSKFIKAPRAPRSPAPRQPRAARVNGGTTDAGRINPEAPPATPGQTPYQVLIEMLDPANMDENERLAIWTLLQYLKKRESE